VSLSYEKEYGKDEIELNLGTIDADDWCLIIDDLLATGGSGKRESFFIFVESNLSCVLSSFFSIFSLSTCSCTACYNGRFSFIPFSLSLFFPHVSQPFPFLFSSSLLKLADPILSSSGGKTCGFAFVIDLLSLGGRQRIEKEHPEAGVFAPLCY
jgi:hypothetical protein